MSVVSDEAVVAAAAVLERAQSTRTPAAPVSAFLGTVDIAAAYRTQQLLTERRIEGGARVVGRKIGLTSEAVQRQIGVDRPDFGVLFDDMRYESDAVIPIDRLLQPKAEAEVAFLLQRDILELGDREALRAAVELAFPAIEIVDSRIANWSIGITDTVADNASSGVYVVGSAGKPLDEFDPAEVTMTMRRGDEAVSEGTGKACLGDPLNALAWLAATAIEFGFPLRAGDLVLSGALGPMVTVHSGDVFTADIAPLGTVTARFTKKEELT